MNTTNNKSGKGFYGVMNSILIVLLFICTACTTHESELESVKIRYYPRNISTPIAITNPSGLFGNKIGRDTIIHDKKFLYELSLRLDSLKVMNKTLSKSNNTDFDLRMYCIIRFKNGSKHELILGEYTGIQYDGLLMYDDKYLLKLIKSASMDHYVWDPEY